MGKRFGALQALDDVSLSIAAGEIHCLLARTARASPRCAT
jgi:ABC-type sugar transport system ATPase subunit